MRDIASAESIAGELAKLDGVDPESIECDTDKGVVSLTVREAGISPKRIAEVIAETMAIEETMANGE